MIGLQDFPWPTIPGGPDRPHWDGSAFKVGNESFRVLAYTAAESNWSEDLTSLHELEAGRSHPIDCASRALAVHSMVALGKKDPVILDVGCSSGFVLEDLAAAIPEARLIGADYLREPLEGLSKRLPKVPILQFDLRECPLPDACVDGVTCLNVLEHIDRDEAALASIYRILRPGGICHLEVPAGPGLYDIYDEHLMHHRRYRLGALTGMARRLGFRVRKATHLGCFVFPAFWYAKMRNRGQLTLPTEEKARLVALQIRQTRSSALFGLVMAAEIFVGKIVSFPVGIRCVAVLEKQ